MPKSVEERLEIEDEFGVPLRDHLDVIEQVSSRVHEQVALRATTASSNWLYTYGLPTKPRDLLSFAQQVAMACMSGLVVDGTMLVNKKALATEDEKKERGSMLEDFGPVDPPQPKCDDTLVSRAYL